MTFLLGHPVKYKRSVVFDHRSDFNNLKSDNYIKFHTYLTRLMHTTAVSVFYKNYLLHYVNILHRIDHDLVVHNNRVERMKSIVHMKCRNFISGLHILAGNRNPESILHADVLSNILYDISQYLLKENMYSLLYDSVMNPYYDMRIAKSFIMNNVLYMTIYLLLKHIKATIMSIYSLHSYYTPSNMSGY